MPVVNQNSSLLLDSHVLDWSSGTEHGRSSHLLLPVSVHIEHLARIHSIWECFALNWLEMEFSSGSYIHA